MDVTGARPQKVTKLSLSSENCICKRHECICAYNNGRKSKCLSRAKIADEGALCHERYCADPFAGGRLQTFEISVLQTTVLDVQFFDTYLLRLFSFHVIDCRGTDTCKIELVSKSVFKKREAETPVTSCEEFTNLIPWAERNFATHVLTIKM